MTNTVYIGIDTSCYTTSLAAVAEDGRLAAEERRVLAVPPGEKGLSQGAMIFQHLQNLPELARRFFAVLADSKVAAVAASTRPRPVEGSYMPVFTVGSTLGTALAAALGVPFWPTTHQEGHVLAGMWSAGLITQTPFLACHLSGGTSEVLLVEPSTDGDLRLELLGGSTDLKAGQLVDRVGVLLGLSFPCGPALEELAREAEGKEEVSIPSSVDGLSFSFSGAETHARRLLEQGAAPAAVARAVERCIAKTVEKVLRRAVEETGLRDILLVGGVAANGYLRTRLNARLAHPAVGARLYFASPRYSTDNAVGAALAAHRKNSAGRQE